MKNKLIAFFIIIIYTLSVHAQNDVTLPALIPQPVKLTKQEGSFILPSSFTIEASGAATPIAELLSKKLHTATGYGITIKNSLSDNTGTIQLSILTNSNIRKEGYELIVSPKNISIKAADAAGLLYGTQTLLQLFPSAIESRTVVTNQSWTVPGIQISDYPRFGWRGLMLDVARHFFTKEQVKDFIDQMVKYKYNMLHLHLTDDQGWRLEIKSLPKLTSVGAWRAERVGRWGDFTKPTPDEPKTYGGFYTQEDMKEIIQYAKDRSVTILPEIDVPGHSLAAVACYPELSCTPGSYQVNAGERFMIWPAGGGFYATIDNTLCPANEKVYEFLDKVFTEVAALFPFEYIHMGGDECYKGFWEKSAACKQLMKKEGLKNMSELQSYFVKRVEKIIRSKGKKLMGWDEILEGGLADEASVMSWRGMKGGVKAAKAGHHVVMSPNDYAYVDLYQGDPVAEPPTYSRVLLNQSYKFNPLPDGVDPSYILGGQANLWSERLTTVRHAQYMLWPRGFAIAESVWSDPAKKDWKNFISRVEKHFERFDAAEVKYSRSMYDPIFIAEKGKDGKLQIRLDKQIDDLDIYYSFDETFPDNYYPKYVTPLSVPKDAANLRVITYQHGKLVGKMITMPVTELQKRANIKN